MTNVTPRTGRAAGTTRTFRSSGIVNSEWPGDLRIVNSNRFRGVPCLSGSKRVSISGRPASSGLLKCNTWDGIELSGHAYTRELGRIVTVGLLVVNKAVSNHADVRVPFLSILRVVPI